MTLDTLKMPSDRVQILVLTSSTISAPPSPPETPSKFRVCRLAADFSQSAGDVKVKTGQRFSTHLEVIARNMF